MERASVPVVLIIMDGFGLLPQEQGNAIVHAATPFFDHLVSDHKAVALHAAGEAVGLPWGEMGNSEVGHLNIGTGRVVLQDYPQITKAIKDGSFFKNQVLVQAVEHVKHNKSRLHLIGLVSKGAVHSHVDHVYALLDLAKKHRLPQVYVHAILDGRDSPPRSAPKFIDPLLASMAKQETGQLATMIGRYYAMDRDRRYDRTQVAYEALASGVGEPFDNAVEALDQAYKKGQSDEFVKPLVLNKQSRIQANDAVVMFNFRADRSIQLVKSFTDPDFEGFHRKPPASVFFVTFTVYEHKLPVDAAFTPIMLNNPQTNPLTHCLSDVIAASGIGQLHIAETEKYAHVTYFFNAGRQAAFRGEEQILVPSPRVATYDKTPAMSLEKIVAQFTKQYAIRKPAFTVINFANADMVGHTGNFKAAVAAIEAMDQALAKVVSFATAQGAVVLVTGDHGNAEQMINPVTKAIDKEHTVNPVPLVIVERPIENLSRRSMPSGQKSSLDDKLRFHGSKPIGIFADIAPTVLDYLQLKPPSEMTGTSLRGLV